MKLIKDYIVRTKLYPVERKVESQVCGNSWFQVCKSIKTTNELTSFTTKKLLK